MEWNSGPAKPAGSSCSACGFKAFIRDEFKGRNKPLFSMPSTSPSFQSPSCCYPFGSGRGRSRSCGFASENMAGGGEGEQGWMLWTQKRSSISCGIQSLVLNGDGRRVSEYLLHVFIFPLRVQPCLTQAHTLCVKCSLGPGASRAQAELPTQASGHVDPLLPGLPHLQAHLRVQGSVA